MFFVLARGGYTSSWYEERTHACCALPVQGNPNPEGEPCNVIPYFVQGSPPGSAEGSGARTKGKVSSVVCLYEYWTEYHYLGPRPELPVV